MSQTINADLGARAFADTRSMSWQPSPSPGVWRKRLDLMATEEGGSEHGRVTSVVRYGPGSAFAAHDHPLGEEILVLEGTFCDEHGEYPQDTYLLNPPGFRHAPFSRAGCVLFVKLRQYGGPGRRRVVVDTRSGPWRPRARAGVEVLPLYADPEHPESVSLVRYAPGASGPRTIHPRGCEYFVLAGMLEDEDGEYPAGSWLRLPPGSAHSPVSPRGCTLYEKRGHLGVAGGGA